MHPLSVPELLTVWERGLAELPYERALTILSAACPESSPAVLARLSIGRRDANLLQLREWAFGEELAIVAACPSCHQTLELTGPVAELRAPAITAGSPAAEFRGEPAGGLESSFVMREYEVHFRSPNTEDVAGCGGLGPAIGRQKLLGCCVTDARCWDKPVTAGELPEDVAKKVMEQMVAVDPQADARLDLVCPECHERWREVFDIVSFFWTEIDVWARRTLREVNVLARAYGWRENDILALSPTRRQIYLAMAQA